MRPILFVAYLFAVILLLHPPVCDAASAKLPLRVQMLLVKVMPLLEKGAHQEAIHLLSEFRNKRKGPEDAIYDHPEVNFALGNCYAMLENGEKARECYLRVVHSDATHRGAWQNLAKTEYELEMYVPASKSFMTSYQLSLEGKKPEPQYLYYSAVTLLMAQQYTACLEKFDLLLQRHPESVTLKWKENLVYALLNAAKPRKALPYMVELADGFTGDKQRQWQELLLQQYMALDMYDKALKLVNKLTRKSPTIAIWWKGLTHIHLQLGNYKKALAAMTIYAYITPMTGEEHMLLADLYLQQGIPQKAIRNYNHCTLGKKDAHTALCLIRAYRSVDQPDMALKKLDEFSKILDSQVAEMERGEILYSMKKYREAAETYAKAAKAKGTQKDRASLMAGYSYWQTEDYDNAIAAFLSAAKEKKYAKEAREAVNRIAQLAKSENIQK